jgi:hypothetical protein
MRLTVLLTIAALSGGCASASKPAPAGAAIDVDTAKMALIDRQAARVGVQVIWINPPRKAASPAGT